MLFLAGLEECPPEVLRDLLAQLRVVGPASLLRDRAERAARSAGGWLSGLARNGAERLRGESGGKRDPLTRVSGESASLLERVGNTLGEYAGRDVSWLEEKIAAERQRLERLSPEVLRWKMLETLAGLAGVDEQEQYNPLVVSREVLRMCARHYGLEVEGLPTEEIERRVARAYLDELQTRIVTALDSGQIDEERLEALIDQELMRLAEGEAEKVRQALDVDRLSGRALLNAVRRGTVTLGMLSAVGAGGIGPFLALSSFIKAVTLLVGVTASFGVYAAAASLLGFLLSPAGMMLVVGVAITPGAVDRLRQIRAAQLAGVVAQLHAVRYSKAGQSVEPGDPGVGDDVSSRESTWPAAGTGDHCPRCGSGKIAFILYGMPSMTPHLQEALEQGRVILGGCVVGLHHWYCRDCGHTFGED